MPRHSLFNEYDCDSEMQMSLSLSLSLSLFVCPSDHFPFVIRVRTVCTVGSGTEKRKFQHDRASQTDRWLTNCGIECPQVCHVMPRGVKKENLPQKGQQASTPRAVVIPRYGTQCE
ncbi:hypothetical protein CYMTET_42161 [Cymbomonas tetramitiformis]|uniref:Uncharacterized protein n=1 Tax=Cymbomonas tetramitiformis TaxID=36881 RepID=A0AAE0C5R5_9CHLO|nr:hypothetical protein CYMTET_42162 [Cymbomonas tetramitiformis]KAK3248371.1 hypothetical protein CYMTET_42161 [Cymbomonas tetramitiformis]